MPRDPTLVLVHSPLVGPYTWVPTAEELRRGGYAVAVASLVGAFDLGPPYYRSLATMAARSIAAADRTGPVVLVGHSGAGPLLPVVADAVGADVTGAVLVDASLPHPGSSQLDALPVPVREHLSGLVRAEQLPPWNEWFAPEVIAALLPDDRQRERFVSELPTLPFGYFEESAPIAPNWPPARSAYLRLSEAYDGPADQAERSGWWVHRTDADHLAMLTRPELIADLVGRAVAALQK